MKKSIFITIAIVTIIISGITTFNHFNKNTSTNVESTIVETIDTTTETLVDNTTENVETAKTETKNNFVKATNSTTYDKNSTKTNDSNDSNIVEETTTTEDEEKVDETENIDTTNSNNKKDDVVENEQPTETEENKSEPIHTHNYSSTITTQPTCINNGITTYICDCGHSYEESIATTDHTWETSTTTEIIHHEAEYVEEIHCVASDGHDFGLYGTVDRDEVNMYCWDHKCSYGNKLVLVKVKDAWDEEIIKEITICSFCGITK